MNGLPHVLFDKKYKKLCLLGEGSYGSVYLCQCLESQKPTLFEKVFQGDRQIDSEYVAVKIYKKPNNRSEGIDFSCLREITCLQMFQHPNLMNCIEVIYSHKKENPVPYEIAAVMNFHLELKALMGKFKSLGDKKRMIKQMVRGLDYLHSNYYFHRDLKLQNIFVSQEGSLKLADYGFTKQFGTPYKKFTTNACTIQYRAPELFFGTHYYTQKSDIWSIGCCMAYVFTNKPLFEVNGNLPDVQILSQIFYLFGTPSNQMWPGYDKFPIKYHFKEEKRKILQEELEVSREVGEFLDFVMRMYPPQRPTAKDMLNHEFFNGVSDQPFDVRELYEQKLDILLVQQKMISQQ